LSKILRQLQKIYFKVFPDKYRHPHQWFIDEFVKKMAGETKKGEWVLDAGAGECQFKPLFKHANYRSQDFGKGAEAWDYSKIDFVCDIEKIPVKNASFDKILCTQVLEHVKSPVAVFKEFNRVMKPKGRLYLTAPQGWEEHQEPHDYWRYTKFGLAYLAESTGFKVISIRPQGGYFIFLDFHLRFFFEKAGLRGTALIIANLLYYPLRISMKLILILLDHFDRKKRLTLNYGCVFEKTV
jgi:SAM-dependent methyltransferase